MKKIKLVALLLLLLTFSLTAAQTNWSFDKSHSKIGFSVTHLVITDVEGRLQRVLMQRLFLLRIILKTQKLNFLQKLQA